MIKDYTKFIWLSNDIDEKVADKIKVLFQNRLTELFDWVIKKYGEMPLGYTENAFTGSLEHGQCLLWLSCDP